MLIVELIRRECLLHLGGGEALAVAVEGPLGEGLPFRRAGESQGPLLLS
jgi:hypothetical protein